MLAEDYNFAGRLVVSPGVATALKKSGARRDLLRGVFRVIAGGDDFGRFFVAGIVAQATRFCGGVVVVYGDAQNYRRGKHFLEVDPATGATVGPAFEIRRGTGELFGSDGKYHVFSSMVSHVY